MALYEKKFIGEGLKATGPNFNVLNILRALIEDEESVVYMPAGYVRGGRKRVDENVHHGLRNSPVKMPITNFIPHMERFNFSVRGLKKVQVEVEKDVLEWRDVFRTYNVIRDGELLIDKIEATLSEETFELFLAAGILEDQRGSKLVLGSSLMKDYIYTVDLSNVPLVSLNWARPNDFDLVGLLEKEQYLSALTKTMARVKKDWEKDVLPEDLPFNNQSTVYVEKTKYAKDEKPTNFIKAPCVMYRVISKELKDMIKENTSVEKVSSDYNRDLRSLTLELHTAKKHLTYIRFLIRAIIFSIENTAKKGSFGWTDLEKLPRSTNKQVQYVILNDAIGKKLERIVWTEKIPVD